MDFLGTAILFKLIIIAILLALLAWSVLFSKNKGNSTPYKANWMLLTYMFFTFVLSVATGQGMRFEASMISIFFAGLVYLTILVLSINRIRQYCSASACVSLWNIMCMLYVFVSGAMQVSNFYMGIPLVIIPIPHKVALAIGIIWGAGFVCSIIRMIYQHVVFCRLVGRDAVEIKADAGEYESRILSVYHSMSKALRKKSIKIKFSPAVSSPVTVGVMDMVLYMPEHEYSDEELGWIFKHELTHVENDDNLTKLMIAFFNSIYWFMPVMKRSSELVAEDIELGCDEIVLAGADDKSRMIYANLILNTSSDCRGFSTCLSATGECVRYRLGRIVHPRARKIATDSIVMAIAIIMLMCGTGIVQASTDYGTASREIFGKDAVVLSGIEGSDAESVDVKKLEDYLNTATVYPGYDDLTTVPDNCSIEIVIDGVRYNLNFSDRYLTVSEYWEEWEEAWEEYDDGWDITGYLLEDTSWKDTIMK